LSAGQSGEKYNHNPQSSNGRDSPIGSYCEQ